MVNPGINRGKVAIVGAAESDLGEVTPGLTPMDLMAQASLRALDDAGISVREVDGIFASGVQTRMAGVHLAEYLKISPRYHNGSFSGGSVFETMVGDAVAAIQAGLCSVALIAYGSTQRSASMAGSGPARLIGIRTYDPLITPFGPRMPMSSYAMAASRHMYEFGTTREQLAEVAVSARKWALKNPVAWEKEPLSVDEVLGARIISSPFTKFDCCLVTDGGGAVVLVSAERAASLRRKPVYVLGVGDGVTHYEIHSMDDLTRTATIQSSTNAFAMAGITASDVDVVELYDAFTINTILFLEDMGFCAKGEGGAFVSEGRIAPGGTLPVNTNGGGLSYGHPGMYGLQLLVEAVRQVRGECGERQVADVNIAVAHGNGGTLSSQSTVVLGGADTL
ncbi:MAG: thiolase [Rhodobiaceae bacterium]|nr:thiolase [Rhodobiaceae bacterium]MCC0056626.1 thiolase [Rhodobiaceae bacterium]